MLSQLNKIRIVLVEPSHPGNIGAVARAMKTMGLTELVLVKPKKFPHYEASKLSAGAESVLDTARVVDRLEDAVADVSMIFGTSVRDREVEWPTLDPRESAGAIIDHVSAQPPHSAAILFGRESSGLTNKELDLCQAQIRINANREYSSLNLANAVQIICYELRMKCLSETVVESDSANLDAGLTAAKARQRLATREEQEGHLEHLQITLEALNFSKSKTSTTLMRKLTRLYNKASLTVEEIQILRGILTAVRDKIDYERSKRS